jgi:hypothetical protein
LRGYFERVFGAELAGTRSDKPDLLRHALQSMGIDPSRAMMIGDRSLTWWGRKNGMTAVGVLYGYGRNGTARRGAHHVAQRPGGADHTAGLLELFAKPTGREPVQVRSTAYATETSIDCICLLSYLARIVTGRISREFDRFIALLVATLLSVTNASAQFYCSRHFYNNSNYTDRQHRGGSTKDPAAHHPVIELLSIGRRRCESGRRL